MVSDEKLYWSDSYMNTISYIGLDGNNRGELTHDPRADIMHIAVVRPKSGQNKVVISQLEVVKTIALCPQKG